MTPKEVRYKDYIIHPAPFQLSESGEWTLELWISKHTDDDIKERKFTASNTFKTREEAIGHCINFGMRIIDGGSDNCSVADLLTRDRP